MPGQLSIAIPRGTRRRSDHGLPKIIGLDEIDDTKAEEISHDPICNKYTKIQQTLDRKMDNVIDGENDHIIRPKRQRNMLKDQECKNLRVRSLDRECKM